MLQEVHTVNVLIITCGTYATTLLVLSHADNGIWNEK
jgi:hypothetical protein